MNSSLAGLVLPFIPCGLPAIAPGPRKRNSLMTKSPANGPVTAVVAVAELLSGLGSVDADETVAVLLMRVSRGVSTSIATTIVTLALSKIAIVPRFAVTVLLEFVAVPWLALAL